jgi:hypothetical protein
MMMRSMIKSMGITPGPNVHGGKFGSGEHNMALDS